MTIINTIIILLVTFSSEVFCVKTFNCTSLDSPWRQFPGLCRVFEANFLVNDSVTFEPHGIDTNSEYEITFMRSKMEIIPSEVFRKIPKLVSFEAQFCQMKEISSVNASNLKKFDVSENEITKVERETFDGTLKLEVLKLSRNQISSIHRETFYWLPELKKVLLSENRLYAIDKFLFSRQTKLEFIDLSRNLLAHKFEMVLYFVPKLDLSLNDIVAAEIEMTVHDIGELVSGCSTEISMQKNQLTDFKVIGEAVVDSLDLSWNNFRSMERIQLEKPARVTSLDLSSNPFSLISGQDLNRYPHLETLNLRNTSLIFGANNIFSQLSRLKSLDLAKNHLASIDMRFFEHLTQLTELVLDRNNLTELNTQEMTVKRSELLKISLFENNFSCEEVKRIVRKLIRINAEVKQRHEWELRRFPTTFQGVECSN
ncbi:leucine-rich repeat-containing protein 15-like [Culicoides brevitarsis]|uniref:leucine-rich repeat-containing protein 15-like n=1 Tax=Culicoides brevitarsis TaxID=469753 RepID=UPI00307B6E01